MFCWLFSFSLHQLKKRLSSKSCPRVSAKPLRNRVWTPAHLNHRKRLLIIHPSLSSAEETLFFEIFRKSISKLVINLTTFIILPSWFHLKKFRDIMAWVDWLKESLINATSSLIPYSEIYSKGFFLLFFLALNFKSKTTFLIELWIYSTRRLIFISLPSIERNN